jgi:transposase
MSRKSIPVVLTQAEVTRLKQWIQAGSTPQRVVLRARIIEAAAGTRQDREIAAQLHVHRRTVALWRWRARQQGIGCVWEIAPGRGRKTPYAADAVGRMVEATLQTKPAGATHWSTRSLARAQGVSKNTIHRIWQEHQIKPHLTKSFKLSRDPKFLEKLTDVVGVYLTPPQNAVVLCVDEKSQIQALDRTQPGLPLKRGRCGTFTHDYERHGTTTLFAALQVIEGRVIGQCYLTLHSDATIPGAHFTGITGSDVDFAGQALAGFDISLGDHWSIFTEYKFIDAVGTDLKVSNYGGTGLDYRFKPDQIQQHLAVAGLKYNF